MDYTVGELAEKVRRPGEDMPALLARLRNWTKEGLLLPKGDRNPGAGRSRLYPESAIADARALSLFADVIGIPAVKSRSFKAFHDEVRRNLKGPSPAPRFLIIGKSLDGVAAEVGSCKKEFLSKYLAQSKYLAHIVIDLETYFREMGS